MDCAFLALQSIHDEQRIGRLLASHWTSHSDHPGFDMNQIAKRCLEPLF
jgi:hypothetical protein